MSQTAKLSVSHAEDANFGGGLRGFYEYRDLGNRVSHGRVGGRACHPRGAGPACRTPAASSRGGAAAGLCPLRCRLFLRAGVYWA